MIDEERAKRVIGKILDTMQGSPPKDRKLVTKMNQAIAEYRSARAFGDGPQIEAALDKIESLLEHFHHES